LFCDLPHPVVFIAIAVLTVRQNERPVARAASLSDAFEGVNFPSMGPLLGPNTRAKRRIMPSRFAAPSRAQPVRCCAMTEKRNGMTTTFDEATTAAIAAFAQLDFYTAVQAMRAEADYDHERDQWISRYIDEHGGDADDAAYDALHAQAQTTPEYAQFVDAVRQEILDYFGVTDDQLDCMIVLRDDDSDELWAEVNRQRSALGTGEVRGDL
jgi:hypothetical protein